MKKLLVALVLAALAPITSFAISIDELNNNPEKYKKIFENTNDIIYVDTNSVESLRYSPPFYSMRGDVYLVSYHGDGIIKMTILVDYDYKQSGNSIAKRIDAQHKQNPISQKQRQKEILTEIMKNTGMTYSSTNTTAWHLNGSSPMNIKDKYDLAFTVGSGAYIAANYLFYQYYEQPFQLDFSNPLQPWSF